MVTTTLDPSTQKAFEANDYYNTVANNLGNYTAQIGAQTLNPIGASISQTTANIQNSIESNIGQPLGSAVSSLAQASQIVGSTSNTLANTSNLLSTLSNTITGTTGTSSLTTSLGSLLNTNSNSSNVSLGKSDQRVRLTLKSNLKYILTDVLEPLSSIGGILFPYSPTITYSGSANYQTLNTVHSNQDYKIYQNTPSIKLDISGKFTAQTSEEGLYLLSVLHFLNVIQKMRFGESTTNKGLPPPVLVLNGYGDMSFNNLNVIVENFQAPYPDNVDYIQVYNNGTYSSVPTIMDVSLTCVVQNTPNKNLTFNWDTYATGSLRKQGGWI